MSYEIIKIGTIELMAVVDTSSYLELIPKKTSNGIEPDISVEYFKPRKVLTVEIINKLGYKGFLTQDLIKGLLEKIEINSLGFRNISEKRTVAYFSSNMSPRNLYLTPKLVGDSKSPFLKVLYDFNYRNLQFSGFVTSTMIIQMEGFKSM